jgi:uncharacterized damage-inducible protein DinB
MPTSNPLDILLSHDRWATQKILEACAGLTEEQFQRRFEIGPGSLHDTTTHVLGAMRRWGDMLAGREQRQRLEGPRRAPAELLGLLGEISADFAASARRHPVEEIVSGARDGKTYTFTRGTVITHVVTHGMHHRAQCLNMLRQLGVKQLPPSSVVEWALTADGAQ